MKSIIFVGTNKSGSSREGIKAAKQMGFYIHLLTDRINYLEQREDFPEIDEIHLVDMESSNDIKKSVLRIHSKHKPVCIISFIDSFVHLAAGLSNELCKTNLSVESLLKMENKLLTRECLNGKNYSPFYFKIKKNDSITDVVYLYSEKLPLIMKLPKSCGSKDVFLINTTADFRHRLSFLRMRNNEEDILVEEYLDGPQVIVEAIVYNGKIEIAAVIEQEITKKDRFIVTGYSISSELDPIQYYALIEVSCEIIRDLGLKNGNCHLELRWVGDKWMLIEANPRISGGVMNDLIKEAYGFNYAEQIIKAYSGLEPIISREIDEAVYAYYMTIDSAGKLIKVTGKNKALKVPGVVDVFIKPKKGQILMPPLSMGSRYGYVLTKGKTREEAKRIALKAANNIKFHINAI